jgi:diguanylate cyclase (GGDEF)-like protein/PAS domain S-box-containing protein
MASSRDSPGAPEALPAQIEIDPHAWIQALGLAAAFRHGDTLWLNPAARRLFGYEQAGEQTLDHWIELLSVRGTNGLRETYQVLEQCAFASGAVVALRHASGTTLHVECFALPLERFELWLLHDVSRRHEFQQQLQITRHALDAMGLFHCVLDTHGKLVDANRFTSTRLGYTRAQLLELHARDIDVGLNSENEMETARQLASGQVVRFESRYRTASGETFPVAVTTSGGRGADGAPIALVIARDITQEKLRVDREKRALDNRRRQAQLLADLAVHPGMVSGNFAAFSGEVVARGAQAIDADRASLWVIDQAAGLLRPFAVNGGGTIETQPLALADVAGYLSILSQGRVLDVRDLSNDPRAAEFGAHFIATLGVRATLDAPILEAGSLVGVLCLEQIGAKRAWTIEEVAFARSLAQLAAQARLAGERQQDLIALRASEQRHARAQRAAGFGSWELDLACGEAWWSDQMYTLFGYSPEDFVPDRAGFKSRIHPDDLARVVQVFDDAMASDATRLQVEYRLRPDHRGDERVIQDSGHIERAADGRALKVTGTALDVTERRQQQDRIHKLAYFDALTGLPNRPLLIDRIERCIAAARRNGTCFAVLFLDLDHFKKVNDSLGHSQGDELLKNVAQRLAGCLREQDTVARLGGDEFIVLLPEIRVPEDASAVSLKLLASLREPLMLLTQQVEVSVSIGVACYPDDGDNAEALLRNADTAMYAAKDQGRDEVRFFTASMNVEALRRLSTEAGLRRALAEDAFELHLQPLFALATGEVRGCEALLRWRHPERGLLLPGEFLPVAELSGLIVPIGERVLDMVCAMIARWGSHGLRLVPVSVNLSAVQLRRGDLGAGIAARLRASGIDPKLLRMEITETVLMERVEAVLPMLHRLGELGVRLAVDDFGTGYSSLGYLMRLPLDQLKLDRSFVHGLDGDDAQPRLIASAVIQLAQRLGLEVVAEGVETEAQLGVLREEGCDAWQGYLGSRPIPVHEFEARYLRQPGARRPGRT